MNLVLLLLIIQTGYSIAKTIDYQSLCKESLENDYRLKKSEEKDQSDVKDTKEQDLGQLPARKMFYKEQNGNYDNNSDDTASKGYTKDETEDLTVGRNSNEFTSDTAQQTLSTVNSRKSPKDVDTNEKIINHIDIVNYPSNQPVLFKKIDPKFILTSKPFNPNKNNTNKLNNSTNHDTNIDIKETETEKNKFVPDTSSKTSNISGLNANENVDDQIVIQNTDGTNIRELRQHLLDHLLDYFINIINEEQYTYNGTRNNNNSKDKMKVEEKLRNYYDPHHLDQFLDEDEDNDNDPDYEENELQIFDYQQRDNDGNVIENQHYNDTSVNITNINPSTLINTSVSSETSQNSNVLHKTKKLEENQNTSRVISEIETLYKDIAGPSFIASKYINNNNTSSLFDSQNDTEKILNTYVKNVTNSTSLHSKWNADRLTNDFALLNDEKNIDYNIDSNEFKHANFSSIENEKSEQKKNVITKENGTNEVDIKKGSEMINVALSPDTSLQKAYKNVSKNIHSHKNPKLELQITKEDITVYCNDEDLAGNNQHILLKKIKHKAPILITPKSVTTSDVVAKNNIRKESNKNNNCKKIVFLILVDQILDTPASKHSKKRKYSESRSHEVTEIDINLQDDTQLDSTAKSSSHEVHEHKKHHKTLTTTTSRHKHILRHHFSKYESTESNKSHHKSALRSPDSHKHHERKRHSYKRKSKRKRKHRGKHSDTKQETNEDEAYKRVTKLDSEEPTLKHEHKEKKHKSHKRFDSSETKVTNTDSQSKNDRVDSKFDLDGIWRPHNIDSKKETPSESVESSSQDMNKHAENESSHSREKTTTKHDAVKNNKLPFITSTKSIKESDDDHMKIILHETDTRSHGNVKEKETAPLVKEIVSVFKEKNEELKNKKIDVNATLNNLASSKLLDILTDRVANQMMKKLKKRFKENSLRTHDFGVTETQPQPIEQIEIIFRNADMVMSSELKTENIYE